MADFPAPTKPETSEQSTSSVMMAGAEQTAPSASGLSQPQAQEQIQVDSTASKSQTVAPQPPYHLPRMMTTMMRAPAIEEATSDDATKANPVTSSDEGPVCVITLLVTSGKKHPYKIDEKYLTKRNVNIPGTTESGHKDPFSISVYTLKELILREWREEWEPKPSSPTLIRLIHFGKLLADKDQLNQYKFSAETSNVVHMSVRPQEIVEEDEPKGTGKSGRDSRNPDGEGRCCVIL
ncbi:unnamed protein product [Parascedosporium putredinis]|uniref:UBL3-like ubiquitin domain-containing protein n=1 Tax=Parascedosporium putredinis TaxID=1442378 RepID=A0A9P1GZ77_9PEZI|nr:unnamed protein product [Parascedosporium putredinis]CAI7991506.1 unnamed protein product [Parascedosporium putredinis]